MNAHEHVAEERMYAFVAGRTGEPEAMAVLRHLVRCDACADRVRAIHHLRSRFDPLVSGLSAAGHGAAYRDYRMAAALRAEAARSPSIRGILTDLLGRVQRGLAVGLKVLLDGTHRIASAAPALLPEEFGFVLQPAVAGIGSPAEALALNRHLELGSRHLAEGRTGAATEDLKAASSINAWVTQAAVSEVRCHGQCLLRITVDSCRGEIAVHAFPQHDQPPPAVALLEFADASREPAVCVFARREGEDGLLATFTDVPNGSHRIEVR